ncbi:hypothetical protein [Paractinoplanes atraurantiacus]|uniref:Uncharacterized protein n=1 Tax=Paractinoplanes atraurantiacus TaxID=1036182 RepID=A0A285IBM8_9ACTN|nr:hypothetical protein [Actinoplanes atraurantiacus]SNY45372.1 hypothetical protein SAMN05421748_107218 [Actinoplanes atraurantiacus]
MANRPTAAHRHTLAAVTAVTLALLAFTADYVDGGAGQVMVSLTSSGFAWGLAALLTGHYGRNARHAAATATTTLVIATVCYYLLILLVSRRWSGGTLQDGTSADLYGLRSVAIMATFWLAGSLVAGPLLGLLGYAIRAAPQDAARQQAAPQDAPQDAARQNDPPRNDLRQTGDSRNVAHGLAHDAAGPGNPRLRAHDAARTDNRRPRQGKAPRHHDDVVAAAAPDNRAGGRATAAHGDRAERPAAVAPEQRAKRLAAVAVGVACGLLSGEGWSAMAAAPPWELLSAGDGAAILHGFVIANAVRVGLPVAVLVWLASTRRLWRHWPLMLIAAVSSAAGTALLWRLLHVVYAYL